VLVEREKKKKGQTKEEREREGGLRGVGQKDFFFFLPFPAHTHMPMWMDSFGYCSWCVVGVNMGEGGKEAGLEDGEWRMPEQPSQVGCHRPWWTGPALNLGERYSGFGVCRVV